MLSCSKISRVIGDREILRDVSVNLNGGEVVALLGPSGCGKTTLLRNLSLLDQPAAGTIEIDGENFDFPGDDRARRLDIYPRVTMVFQQFQLFPHLTILQNITLPMRKSEHSVLRSDLQDLVNLLGIEQLLTRFPHQVSVGQKQRVAFARAVLLKPNYLFLDEVTSSLDVEHIGKIMEVISRIRKEGKGVLVTTHLIGFAKSIADRVVFMDHGRVVEEGDTSILDTPKSPRLTSFLSLLNTSVR